MSNAWGLEIPARSLIADTFKLEGARQVGTELKGSSTEIGNSSWKVLGSAILREDGALTIGTEKGATAWVPLGAQLSQTPFKAQIACQPATTDWVGLALGGELSAFFNTAKISLNLRPNGQYALYAGNSKEMWTKPLAQGKSAKFQSTGWNTLEIEFDPTKYLLSASVNGEKIVVNQNVETVLGGASIGFAGFRFNEATGNRPPSQPKVPAVDDFAIVPLGDLKPVTATPVVATPRVDVMEPANRAQFFLRPGQQEVLKWRVPEGVKEVGYRISDYQNRPVLDQKIEVKAGEVQLPLNLKAGYYEIEFPEQKQRYGLVALPPHQGAFDKFFSIDTSLSWLEMRAAMRADLVASLKRSGIGVARERLTWGSINPKEGQWDFETARQFDSLRKEYQRNGLQLLEVFHSAPDWVKSTGSNPFPQRLNATKESWQTMAKRWGGVWNSLEVWNEPDIDFGGEVSADQYLPAVKTISYALRESQSPTLVGGGVFAYFTPTYIREAVRNGLLDQVDFVSFHTYAKAPSLEQIVTDYRGALGVKGQPSLPLWLTESGQAWASGQPRPTLTEDTTSALDITMKAIESKACGIGSYFAFVYPFYVEGRHNFGMMGQEVSPLRSMGAYTQAVKALSNAKYVGDLNIAGAQRARVFSRGDEAVIALYTEKPTPESAVSWAGNATRIEGIDGRVLNKLADGKIPLSDGLTYVYTPLKTLKGVESQTVAAKLYQIGQTSRARRPDVSPIVLQPLPPVSAQATKRGYRVEEGALATFPLRVRVNNLSNAPAQVRLRPTINGGEEAGLTERQIEVGASGATEVQWDVNLTPTFQKNSSDNLTLGVSGQDSKGKAFSPISFDVLYPRDLETYLRFYPQSNEINLTDLGKWANRIGPTGQMKLSVDEGKVWQLQSTFKGANRWVYPEFPLSKAAMLSGSAGILVRARATASASVRLMVKERGGSTYFTPFSFIPTDGQWHTTMIPWGDLAALPSAPPDPNGKLDLDTVDTLAIGTNPKADGDSLLEVSNLYITHKTN